MNSFTNTILTLLLGWLRTLLNVARDFISSDSSTAFFDFFRANWKIIFLILCVGGFVLDKIIYLIRWQPSPFWVRWRQRHRHTYQPSIQPHLEYGISDDYSNAPEDPDPAYEPTLVYPAPQAAPTLQYHMQQPAPDPVNHAAYTVPYTPQQTHQPPFTPSQAEPSWEPAMQDPANAPAPQQHFAFGMAPSFGSAQSEPAYHYPDTMPSFAPPSQAQTMPQQTFAPLSNNPDPAMYDQQEDLPASDLAPTPQFRPFSDRNDDDTFALPKNKRLGTVARKARNLLSADDAYESLTYQDIQPTVDVSKAFHSPVYPEKKPEGDA